MTIEIGLPAGRERAEWTLAVRGLAADLVDTPIEYLKGEASKIGRAPACPLIAPEQ
jgi:hypothetical protein